MGVFLLNKLNVFLGIPVKVNIAPRICNCSKRYGCWSSWSRNPEISASEAQNESQNVSRSIYCCLVGVSLARHEARENGRFRQYPIIGTWKKMKFSFFHQRHALSTSFDIFVVTYRVTNFLPKLVHMLLFSTEKTEFPFFWNPLFSGIAGGFWPVKHSAH